MVEDASPPAPALDADTENRILAAAHAVFTRRGTHGARMQEIADEAGVNKALLHYYFRSKERLAEAVFGRAAGQLLPRIFQVLGSAAPLEEKVREVVEVETDFMLERPYLPGYVLGEANFNPDLIRRVLEGRGRPPIGALQAQLDAAAQGGRLRPTDAEQFLVNLLSLILFPFVARPMMGMLLGMDDERWRAFVLERRGWLADFLLDALRP
ncbi:MAG TPA: helix-turn-helix domain-containing protein [Longimicrobium sp.]|jgi:AcrR family transcriptional regulator